MIKQITSTILLTTALTLVSCGDKTALYKEDRLIVHTQAEMLSQPGGDTQSDPVNIDSAWIEGDMLHAKVSYSGGCQDHEFKLMGDNRIMKSLPPQRVIWIDHNANGDVCRELIERTLKFNIKPLAMQGDKPDIVFRLRDYKGSKLVYPAP